MSDTIKQGRVATMSDLPKRLRIKAGMIKFGERIAWGSDTALMEEAAERLEEQTKEINRLREALEEIAWSHDSTWQSDHATATLTTSTGQEVV